MQYRLPMGVGHVVYFLYEVAGVIQKIVGPTNSERREVLNDQYR